MSRPRIRTIKPEIWADEKIGTLSRDARGLFVGLITMADDEGRLRGLPAAILGHVFPYDQDASSRLEGWLSEVERAGLILRYQVAGVPYTWLTGWAKHQVINRPSASQLPPPPAPPMSAHGSLTDESGTTQGAATEGADPHAQARVPADRDQGSGSGSTSPSSNGTAARAAAEQHNTDWAKVAGIKGMGR